MPATSINPDYMEKIRRLIGNYSRKTSVSPFSGSFRSIYRGKSMEFDDLREYVYGDDISDIDWKSSTRTGTILVRRFIAEKRHSALVVCDTGPKMDADTPTGEHKKDVLVETAGVISYIVNGHGDDLAFLHQTSSGLSFEGFKNSESHMMRSLASLDRSAYVEGPGAEKLLDHISSRMERRMVVFFLTDMEGISRIGEKDIKRAVVKNDLIIFSIDDAYLFGDDTYDVSVSHYSRKAQSDRKIAEAERAERESRLSAFNAICHSAGAVFQVVTSSAGIVPAVYTAMTRNGA